jgi:bis(5'-nucleosyl)-tetraphosphatase (symmetrical)
VSRHAVGDVQGCYDELRALLERIGFSADRDRLWFVGDLVNRGPKSLEVLRLVRSLGDNAVVVLGNHDLHLLAVATGGRRARPSDTLETILSASDREKLLEWLASRPLAHFEGGDLMVHAGVVPQWTVEATLALASEVQSALAQEPQRIFDNMYGDQPDHWSPDLAGTDRLRFVINVLTRMRVCTREGRINLEIKGKPPAEGSPWLPWFDVKRLTGAARVICGHWSALGLLVRRDVVALDTGCVWGGALTAFDLDCGTTVSVPSHGYRAIED